MTGALLKGIFVGVLEAEDVTVPDVEGEGLAEIEVVTVEERVTLLEEVWEMVLFVVTDDVDKTEADAEFDKRIRL